MPTRKLSRRTMLRGAGSTAIALPFLEAMMPSKAIAGGSAIPTRYVFCYGGISAGRVNTPNEGDTLAPDQFGALEEVGGDALALQTVFDQGMASDLTLISNLTIPWANSAGAVPDGGRLTELGFHFGPTVTPQLSGLKALSTQKGRMLGPSSDQLVAEAIGGDSLFPSLSYRVQPVNYNGGGPGPGRLSFRESDGDIVPLDPIVSPRLAYETLFSSFTPPDASDAEVAALMKRVSVLDRVADSTSALLSKVGTADRLRMERHLHEVRQLELQLSEGSLGDSESCVIPKDPGKDPTIGQNGVGSDGPLGGSVSWSSEDDRARVLTDVLHMALTCDLTRSATLMYTFWKSWMSAAHLGDGWEMDIHEVGHSPGTMPRQAMADVIGWHVGHFARLARKLRDTQEVDGSSLLDHTAMVLTFEGGHGEDPLSGSYSTHSTENMTMLLAGGAGGLRAGQHIDGAERHPSRVTLTAMRAAGYEGDFGDHSTSIDDLLG